MKSRLSKVIQPEDLTNITIYPKIGCFCDSCHRALTDITLWYCICIVCSFTRIYWDRDVCSCMLVGTWTSSRYACVLLFVIYICRYSHTGMCLCMDALFFMVCTPEDKTRAEWRAVICEEMPQLIISVTSSSWRRSADVWHVSASADGCQSWLKEWWNEAGWEMRTKELLKEKKW